MRGTSHFTFHKLQNDSGVPRCLTLLCRLDNTKLEQWSNATSHKNRQRGLQRRSFQAGDVQKRNQHLREAVSVTELLQRSRKEGGTGDRDQRSGIPKQIASGSGDDDGGRPTTPSISQVLRSRRNTSDGNAHRHDAIADADARGGARRADSDDPFGRHRSSSRSSTPLAAPSISQLLRSSREGLSDAGGAHAGGARALPGIGRRSRVL